MSPVHVWVGLSAVGLVLSMYLAYQSWQDIRALGHLSNGRRWAAFSRFAREGLRVTVHWVWLLLGVSVLLDIRLGAMFVVSLLYGNVVLVTNSLIDARTRSLIYKTRGREPEIPHP
jgi:hypothetical protein